MSRKKWTVKSFEKEKASYISEQLNISPYAALLASARGVNTVEEAQSFFGFDETAKADPMDFTDMYPAVVRIRKALDDFERIAVYGDYDCDGVTATALLYSYLEMQGADVVYCVPNRHTEGYGLNYNAIDNISRMGAKLIITVDNGISAVDEAKYIKQLEMDLIVTDHHLPGEELPDGVAVVDPHIESCNLSFRDYAGVGVAYKLICALEGEENEVTDSFLDLVAIGTIADVMPLYGENRQIVRKGIELINDTDRVGLQALIEVAGLSEKAIKSGNVAFGISPRINAAGRMGAAERAIQLLLSDDYDEATQLAEEINGDNALRQQTEQDILNDALIQIESNPDRQYDNVIVVSGEGWHDGVIGIVASRLVELYGKPAIVITVEGDNAKGSGRSIEGFNLYDALCSCAPILSHYGGHMLAAGLGLDREKIDEFRERINAYGDRTEMPFPVQSIDFKINPSVVNTDLLDTLELLEPFGAGNPQPTFGLYNMTVTEIVPVGSGKCLRFGLRRGNTVLSAIRFKMTALECPFVTGDTVDVAANFEPNEYMGQMRISILIKNMKFHETDDDILFPQMRKFEALMKGKEGDFSSLYPQRDFMTAVYKFVRSRDKWRFDNETLLFRMGLKADCYAKLCVAVEAFVQLGVLVRDEQGSLTLPETSAKVNLDDAPILKKLRN